MTMTDMCGASRTPQPGGSDGDGSLKDMASAAVETVKGEAASFAAAAQDKASEKIAAHTETATQTLGDFASAIRKAGDDLAQNDQSVAGRVVKQAADGLESLTRTIAHKRPEELLDTVRDFGRKNPAAFIAGSVLLGIAVGRLAKSTEQRGSGGAAEPEYRRPTDYLASSAAGGGTGASSWTEDPASSSLPPYGTTPGSGI